MFKIAAMTMGTIVILALGVVASSMAGGGHNYPPPTTTNGHTPVTICHKPGTPAEMTLVVDDDAVPGHLGHGDYLGPCEGDETETTPDETDTTPDETETTPTTPTTTTPVAPPTGAASVICDRGSNLYRISGTINGQAADSVSPSTIPGNTKGTTNVTVTRGDTSFRTSVDTYGDCAPTPDGGTTSTPSAAPTATTDITAGPPSPGEPAAATPVQESTTRTNPGKPAAAKPPAANSPQPATPAPVKPADNCPANERVYKGQCYAIVQGNG